MFLLTFKIKATQGDTGQKRLVLCHIYVTNDTYFYVSVYIALCNVCKTNHQGHFKLYIQRNKLVLWFPDIYITVW